MNELLGCEAGNCKRCRDCRRSRDGDHIQFKLKRGLDQIRREIAALGPLERLAVMHTRCPEVARALAHTLAEEQGFPETDIPVVETGPALAVHGGPGVVGVAAVQREG